MSYNHYAHLHSHYPTNIHPQSSWGGIDFYHAHAVDPDPSLYYHAWDRVRNYSSRNSSYPTIGVAVNEARHWHHRAYESIGKLSLMRPAEIGHAAAYEAYRTWAQNYATYNNLSGASHNQREALIGLAVAEASRLLAHAGRHSDRYASMTASEASAATVSNIFENQDDYHHHHGYRRSRSYSRSRYGSASSMSDVSSDDGRHLISYPNQSHSRPSSHSHHISLQSTSAPNYSGTPYLSSGHLPPAPPGSTYSYGGMPSSYSSYGNEGIVAPPVHGTPYPPAPLSMPPSSSYLHTSTPLVIPTGPTAYSQPSTVAYNASYMGQPVAANGVMLVPPPQTIVIRKKSKHKHKHRSRSRARRSRSVDQHHHPHHRI